MTDIEIVAAQLWAAAQNHAHRLVQRHDLPRRLIQSIFNHSQGLAQGKAGMELKAVADLLADTLAAIEVMPMPELGPLVEHDIFSRTSGAWSPAQIEVAAKRAKDVLDAHPVLGPVAEAIEAASQRRVEAMAAQSAAMQAQAIAAVPGVLLASLRKAGIELDVDKAGNLVAPGSSAIPDQLRSEIADHKARLVEIIAAEKAAAAEVSRLVVIA